MDFKIVQTVRVNLCVRLSCLIQLTLLARDADTSRTCWFQLVQNLLGAVWPSNSLAMQAYMNQLKTICKRVNS